MTLGLAALLVAFCAPAAPSEVSQDTARVVLLPPISVNALRTSLPLQRAPVSVSILGPEQTLARGPGLALGEAVRGLAGVQLDDRHNQALGERISIRGFGARSTFGIRGVRVLVDGIPATMPDGQSTLNHVDPAQIVGAELVRGAAAAFLGNAAGGALQLSTGAVGPPGVALETGAAELRRLSGAAAFSFGSAYASWQQHDGSRDYSVSERLIGGGVFAFPSSASRLEGALHATRYEAENPGSLTAEQAAADPVQANPNNIRQRTAERGTHGQVGLGWVMPLATTLALEVRGHVGARSLENPIPPVIIELDRSFGGIRAQATRTGPRLTLAAGAELEAQRDARLNFTNQEGSRGSRVLDQRETVRGAAAFAQASWSPVTALQLFGAARHDGYRFSVDDRLIGPGDSDNSGARQLEATSFTAGASVQLTPGLQFYANLASAFETPTTTELANRPDGEGGFNPTLQPERTLGGEAALRLEHAGWRGEATVFRAAVRDKLVAYEVPALPGRQFFRNAGQARHQGIELSAWLQPMRALELRAAYTRLDVRFRQYLTGDQDHAGRRVPGVAGHRLELQTDFRLGGSLHLLLHALENGRVAVNDANSAVAAAYTLIGGRLDHAGFAVGPLSVAAHAGVDNALGRNYTAAVSVNAVGGRYFEPGPRRSAYAGVRLTRR